MSVIAVARVREGDVFSLPYLKEIIGLYLNENVPLLLRLFIKVENGSSPISACRILFADRVTFVEDKSHLLSETDYMNPLAERGFEPIDESRELYLFRGEVDYRYRIVPVGIMSSDRDVNYKEWADERITDMKLHFENALEPDPEYLYASYALLNILDRDVKLKWFENQKTFITECRTRKTSSSPDVNQLLDYYGEADNRVVILKHELWVRLAKNYNVETTPSFLQLYPEKRADFIRQKRFDIPTSSRGTAVKLEFKSDDKKWLNEIVNVTYRKILPSPWITYSALVFGILSIILFLLFRFVWSTAPTIPKGPQ